MMGLGCRAAVRCCVLSLVSLAGCGSDHGGTDNSATATPSTASALAVVSGGSQTFSISFNASDKHALSDLVVTTDLTNLPQGWSGPTSFGCASVTTGSGCVLNLTYAPTGASSGTLVIDYTYKNNSGTAETGSQSVTYSSTTSDNVVAMASPTGQITAVVGANGQSVGVNFTTDDGNPATALALTTDLTSLPAGWSSTATTFTCASVSTGNGCQLPLTYAPTAAASGTLKIAYSYEDDSGTAKTGSLSVPYAATTQDDVVAIESPSGQVNAVVGASGQSVAINFTTNDGNPASDFLLTTDLTTLPVGWSSSVTTLSCASVSTGNGCHLPLTYAPVAAASGTLVLTYSYNDNSGTAKSGTVLVDYAATTQNGVVGTVTPGGQVNAVVGASGQSVGINFTSSDGNPATGFLLTTNLASLPAGWSSTVTTLSCASVSTGNGCHLPLAYTPAAAGSGTVVLAYSYNDNSGTAKTGTVRVDYAATTQNSVVATATPNGQVNAVVGAGSQFVSVQFTTNDGNPATALEPTTDLTSLPAGWSSTDTAFSCTSVSTGNGCQLPLTYAPSQAAGASLSLNYRYLNNSGVLQTGSVSIPYVATTHDNVVATPSPSGQINAVVGSGSQQVSITFKTDDGNNASALQVTSLGALPTGWSGPGSLTCASVNNSSNCSLSLTYAPGVTGSGTLTLNYSYSDDSGTAKTGSLSIQYAATADDNVVGTPDQSSLNAYVGGSTTDNVTFTTDDGNVASNVALTSPLSGLPAGWSSTVSSFTCASASTGTTCVLPLTFAPGSTSDSGTLTLNYSYTSNSGTAKTGSVNITYAALPAPNLYVTDYFGGAVYVCPTSGATVGACTSTGSGFNRPTSITFYGSRAYVTNDTGYTISMCTVASGGSLSNCTLANSGLDEPQHVTFNATGTYAYVWDNFGTNLCTVNTADGTLPSCTRNGLEPNLGNLLRFPVIAADGIHVYGEWANGGGYDPPSGNFLNAMSVCSIASDGTINGCAGTGTGTGNANLTFALYNGNVYASSEDQNTGNGGVLVCPINSSDGSLGSCQAANTGNTSLPQSIAVAGGYAYLVYFDNTVEVCPVVADGTFGTCSTVTIPLAATLNSVAVH